MLDEIRPVVVSFHFGLPPKELLARVKRLGAKILSSATTLDEALWLEAHGVDAEEAVDRLEKLLAELRGKHDH